MIIIGERNLNLDDFYKILFEGEKVDLDSEALNKVQNNYDFLENFSKNKVIYGINTCFGPMAQYKISDDDQKALQYNKICDITVAAFEIRGIMWYSDIRSAYCTNLKMP